jgi:uncharacterized protein (TIGR02271 family)
MQEYRSALHEGMTVYSIDDEKLGKIIRCDASTFIIEKGIFFPKDYIARYADIANVAGDEVRLNLTRDMLVRADDVAAATDLTTPGATTAARTRDLSREEVRVPLAEERLEAEKRAVERGAVEVRKDVKTEERHITVPVRHEEVRVERHAVDRPLTPGDAAFKEQAVRVPVVEEEVEIHKRPVVREEVRVTKQPYVEQRTASDTVKREEVDIDEKGTTRVRRDDDDLKKY